MTSFENMVVLQGRVVKDPFVKSLQRQDGSTTSSVTFTLAVNRSYANKQTGKRDADFVSCVAYGRLADNIAKFAHKGKKLGITGTLHTRHYTDQATGKEIYVTEVMVDNFGFPESKSAENARSNNDNGQYAPQKGQYASQGGQQGYVNNNVPVQPVQPQSNQNSFSGNAFDSDDALDVKADDFQF